MSKRIGAQTTALPSCPGLIGWAGIAGQKEKEGPYGAKFDWIIPDELNGEQSFESAERAMLEQAVVLCAEKAGTRLNEIQMLLAGDLLNQIISAGFAARNLGIPFYGLYGACSTMSESLSVGGMLADGGFADRLICATCSHFCTAERQYRAPLELGNQRTPTAQWTVTGAGAVMISGSKHAPVVLTHTTCGRVVDLGITDANNMGAAMTPAAFDTLAAHFRDLGRGFADYDLVVTGDLGRLGRELLIELLREKKIDVDEGKLFDCGCEIFSERQDVHSGGSGCGWPIEARFVYGDGRAAQPDKQYAGRECARHRACRRDRASKGEGRVIEILWMLVKAFLVGGLFCAIGQVLIMKTQLTSARILVGYVTAGVILGALGLYKPIVDFAGAGATVPLLGFGYALARGAIEGVKETGILGAFTGGVTAAAGGIAAAVFFGYLAAVLFKPKMKS